LLVCQGRASGVGDAYRVVLDRPELLVFGGDAAVREVRCVEQIGLLLQAQVHGAGQGADVLHVLLAVEVGKLRKGSNE
jgi:hypothetical protein